MKKLLISLLLLALFTGCSSNDSAISSSSTTTTESSSGSYSYDTSADTNSLESSQVLAEKIAYTINLSIETKQFEQTLELINQSLIDFSGFIESSSIGGTTSRYANYTVRVPATDYIAFLDTLENAGNVYSISTYAENLTSQFIDIESRLTTLETEQTRLLELLEKAETVEDIITIEQRLSSITYEIETLTTNLNALSLRVDYSTITIRINEVIDYQQTDNFFQDIKASFTNSFQNIKQSLQNFVINAIYIIPFLFVWGIIFSIFYLIFKKFILKFWIFLKKIFKKLRK